MKCKQNAEETCMDYPNKCHLCGAFDEDIYVPTNADRIRAMSDEELREFLCSNTQCRVCKYEGWGSCELLNWLQQPAEGD